MAFSVAAQDVADVLMVSAAYFVLLDDEDSE